MDIPRDLQALPQWRQYLLLGERLLEQPDVTNQCRLIETMIKDLFGASSHVWLSGPYFPLPGDLEYPILPAAKTSTLVQDSYNKQLSAFESGQNTVRICYDQAKNPHSLAIPLVSQDNMLGILEISREEGLPFDQKEISFLEGLASHAAVSMQIIRQVTIKNWRMEQVSLVQRVTEQIANVLDLDELTQRISRLIQSTFSYYYVAIYLVNGKKRSLELRAESSLQSGTGMGFNFSIQMGEGIIGYVAKSGREVVAPNVNIDPLYKKSSRLPETLSEAAFPMKIDKKILGVLDIQSDLPGAFHEYDVTVLRSLANSIAVAVQDASLYSSLHRRAEQLRVIFEVSSAVNSILDLDELLQKIILTIKKQYQQEEINLYTVHPGRRKVFFQTGISADNQEILNGQDFDMDAPHGIIPWVSRTNISAMTNNAVDDSRFEEQDFASHINLSHLVVPLLYTGEILGIMEIQNKNVDAFDENDLFIVEALASTISTALRNANLFRSERWRHQVADSFRNVISMISANTALEELLENILSQLNQNLPCDAASIWLLDSKNGSIHPFNPDSVELAATWGVEKDKLLSVLRDKPSSWKILESVVAENTPIIRSTNWDPGPIGISMGFPPDYSSISVPLKIGDSVFGILSLAHHTAHRYGPEAKDMTITFANYAAIAIHNARLYADSQEQAWISTVLLQVAQTCQAASNPEDLLQSMARLIPLMIGVQKCAFFIFDQRSKVLTLKAQYGLDLKVGFEWDSTVPAVYQLLQTRKPIYIQQPDEELLIQNLEINSTKNTCVLLPLQIRNEILGALLVIHEGDSLRNARFSNETLSILLGITQQTAITLDNLRLLEERQEEAYTTAVLLQVAQAVVSQSTIEDTFDTIINLLPILIGVNLCAIYLPSDDPSKGFQLATAYSDRDVDLDNLKSLEYTEDIALFEFIQHTNQLAVAYLPSEELNNEEWMSIQPLPILDLEFFPVQDHMLMAFPITIKTELLGILLTKEDNLSPAYFVKRMELLTGVSQEIALAIQNYQLQLENVNREKLEQEMELARQIQKTFLPDHIPAIKGWNLLTRWETALQVGGDFFDIIPLSSEKIGLVIADVADKGLAASLYMTVSRTLIRAFGQTMSDPGSVLKSVNNLLTMDAPGGLFVTAVYAVLDVTSGKMIYANAGHNLPILFNAKSGNLLKIPKGDMALGVVLDNEYHNHELNIDDNDILILYTDGLTEMFSRSGEMFGLERLEQMIKTCNNDSLSNLLQYFDEELTNFRDGAPPSDDLTIIALKRTESD